MKRLLIGMLLVLAVAGCASRRSYMDGVYDTLPYDFHRYIKGYFYEYLRYPDIDELFAYCWGITNSANEYVYKSYDEFDARIYGPANVAGPEPLLGYIHKKRTLLCLREHKGDLQILLNSKVMQVEHFDVCAMQKDWGNDWDFFLLHDSAGVRMNGCPSLSDADRDFSKVISKMYRVWFQSHGGKDSLAYQPRLMRYSRKRGLEMMCKSNQGEPIQSYVQELAATLDTFIVSRSVDMIQFVLRLPMQGGREAGQGDRFGRRLQ